MLKQRFHRLISTHNADEQTLVQTSGQLWGHAPRLVAGNGPARVKAFMGTLPDGAKGYTFITEIDPTRTRYFFGKVGVEWCDGAPGVKGFLYDGRETVLIPVQIVETGSH